MGNYSEFKSRKAIAKCNNEKFFQFASNPGNFERFAQGSLSGWKADEKSCSFSVSPVGDVTIERQLATPSSAIQYAAVTSLTGRIILDVAIEPLSEETSGVTLTIGLELSPLLRMMVAPQAEEYLERLAVAIESLNVSCAF